MTPGPGRKVQAASQAQGRVPTPTVSSLESVEAAALAQLTELPGLLSVSLN